MRYQIRLAPLRCALLLPLLTHASPPPSRTLLGRRQPGRLPWRYRTKMWICPVIEMAFPSVPIRCPKRPMR